MLILDAREETTKIEDLLFGGEYLSREPLQLTPRPTLIDFTIPENQEIGDSWDISATTYGIGTLLTDETCSIALVDTIQASGKTNG